MADPPRNALERFDRLDAVPHRAAERLIVSTVPAPIAGHGVQARVIDARDGWRPGWAV